MQPLEDLLSSPERTPFVANGRDTSSDANDSGSDDMDLETSTLSSSHGILQRERLTAAQVPVLALGRCLRTDVATPFPAVDRPSRQT